MKERIAEAGLAETEEQIAGGLLDFGPDVVGELIAEVRRLRGLIVAAHPDYPPSLDEATGRPAAVDAIEAEARTIREELDSGSTL